ncbi:BQ5605_C006g03911 [Microbotryum silenes-dioicae]|uniref:BQ5605_C006g03911 protein n=1 Tax=Microbotryum silenes-dioicae TaxID=796604 RepID=A0A2X0P7R1_9BASI|nr:BQ5605_C006g03911 [Microbotryum silenes-dioicae]
MLCNIFKNRQNAVRTFFARTESPEPARASAVSDLLRRGLLTCTYSLPLDYDLTWPWYTCNVLRETREPIFKGMADVTFPSIDPNGGFLANTVYCLARNCIPHDCSSLLYVRLRCILRFPSFAVEKRLKVACPVQRMDLTTPDTASRRAAPIECTKPRM